jgi:hypothetical protein
MIAVAADKSSTTNNSSAADKAIERLLLSLKEDRDALALKEHAQSVAQSRRTIYFVLTFAAGVIAGALLMKAPWPQL